MAYVSSSYLLTEAAAQKIHLAGHELQMALRAAKGVFPVSSIPDLKELVSVSFIEGFRMNALMFFLISFLGFLLALFLRRFKAKKAL